MRKLQFLYLILIAFSLSCFASASYALPANNGITITGTTSDSSTHAPIQDVTVSTNVSGTSFKATTDNLGKYTLNITFNRKPALISLVASKKNYLPSIKLLSNIQPGRSYTVNFSLRDITSPSKPIVTDDGQYTNSITTLHAKWSSEDAESGIREYRYSIGTSAGATDILRWTSAGKNTEITSTNLKLTPNKTYYFNVRAVNGVGLISPVGSSDGIIVDTTAPTGTININNNAQYTKLVNVTLTLSATDTGSGVSLMQFSNDGTSWSTPESYTTSESWTLASGDGTKTVYAKFKDVAGNWSAAVSATIVLDTTPPVQPTIDTLSSPTNINSQTITGTKSADAISIVVTSPTVTVGAVSYPSSTTWECQLTNLTEGTNNITVEAVDVAGNESTPASGAILLDTIAPTGTININNNAQYTNSTAVTLSLSATDAATGVSLMQFSNDGTSWSDPEAYATSKSWNLNSGDGTKTVYARFIDGAGNISTPATNTIILDTIAPVIVITSPQNGFVSTSQTITVSGTINDNQATVTVNGVSATVSNNTFSASGIALTQGSNIITATATDLAGNNSSSSITVNYQPVLSIAITSPANNALVSSPTISVSGTVTDQTATVKVNGTQATVTDNAFSALNIPLTEGTNIITATATRDTQTAQATTNVILDTTPPSISIYTPDANSTTRSNIVYGSVSNDTQTVTVNGTSAEILSDFRFIGRPVLPEGANTITVQATDKAGNTNQKQINITYNTQTPKVTITSPVDNSTQNISPINVQGTNTTDLSFIAVNSATALINNTNFTAEGVILDTTKTVVTASGYDANNNQFSDSIVVNSPNLANYEVIKVSGDATEDDTNRPTAGSNQTLKVRLDRNDQPASNEEIQFRITQGNGALSSASSSTNINGEATITLTTDTNSDMTNQVECFPTNNPLLKTTFLIDTKPGQPSILTKITDDLIAPVPGVTIPLIVKLTDSNNNPIQDETINFQVIQGIGTISSPTTVTTYYGEAKVNLTCPNLGLVLTQVQASSQTVPSVTATFNITTSALLVVTVDDVIAKVNLNDSNIQDIKADITMTSNAPFLPPTMQLKIWQNEDKQKVEELSPTPQVKIRPPLQTSTENVTMQREIISYDTSTNIYKIKTKQTGQIEEYPYQIDYVDYNKGVTLKTEYYSKEADDTIGLYTIEDSDFVQINGVWVFTKETKTLYENLSEVANTTTSVYSNIHVNSGIPDGEFQ